MPVRRSLLWFGVSLLVAISAPRAVAAQNAPAAALKVFLDCNDFQGCDFDFFRTEITAVNWVRDRQVADIHVLVTTQTTGSGGREYTSTFIGLGRFTGVTDTLKYASPPAAPQDEVRRGLAQVFRSGLVRYIARHAGRQRSQDHAWRGTEGREKRALRPNRRMIAGTTGSFAAR